MFTSMINETLKKEEFREREEKEEENKKKELFIEFKKKLEIITTIKVGDKLSKSNGDYYIDGVGITQRMRRWWYSQNRKKTFEDLTKDFWSFTDFLDNILAGPQVKELIDEMILFINDLMVGLYNLKTTYPDYNDIRCKIDSIIMTLIDFKDGVNAQPIKLMCRRNSFN
jgi:hypothetical protein